MQRELGDNDLERLPEPQPNGGGAPPVDPDADDRSQIPPGANGAEQR